MIFCDVQLAQRIEQAERRLVESAVAAVHRRVADPIALSVGGGFAAFTEPGSPLNKVVGLGFQAFDEAAWAQVEAAYARRGAPIQVELSTLGDPAVAKFLTGRGYRLVSTENVLGRVPAAAQTPLPAHVRIDTVPASALDEWIDVMVTGFGSPDLQGVLSHESYERAVIERIMRDFAAAVGVDLFLAYRAGEAAGTAAMRRDGGIAQLCGAATLPMHRRRGVQSALLAHRLAHAARCGCELVVVTTQPGSTSQQNVMRQGFGLLYSRNVLVRDAAAPGDGTP